MFVTRCTTSLDLDQYEQQQDSKSPTDLIIQARQQSGASKDKRWPKTQSLTNAYVFAKCPIFHQKIPIAIIQFISVFHYEFYWQFHPFHNPKYPQISVSKDGQTCGDLMIHPNFKYKAINFGPILTYGAQFRCIFEMITPIFEDSESKRRATQLTTLFFDALRNASLPEKRPYETTERGPKMEQNLPG